MRIRDQSKIEGDSRAPLAAKLPAFASEMTSGNQVLNLHVTFSSRRPDNSLRGRVDTGKTRQVDVTM